MALQFASHPAPRRRPGGLARLILLLAVVLGSAGAAAAPTDLARVGGQAIELRRVPADPSQPPAGTIVFENGLRGDLDGWQAVVDGLVPAATQQGWALFTYNRPGIGRSEPTERPRDGHQVVADLHELLRQQGLPPPYLLVGHSLGGLYQQLFAREHPQETAGLVLVDAVYPGIIKKPEDFPFYTRWAKGLLMSRMAARETDAIHATGEQVLALPWPARIPVERLVNVPKSAGAVAVDFGVVNDDEATFARVRAMYPGARTTVLDSDHQIQQANPEAVVKAVLALIDGGAVASRPQASATSTKAGAQK